MTAPVIVLVNPQMGENIGAAARAMANFGLTELRIVDPRDGWPNAAATAMAAHGVGLIERATVHASIADAVADCAAVMATSARLRYMNKPISTVREWVAAPTPRTAILFGRERSGLTNEEVAQAQTLLTIPVDPDCPSLNLAQSVGIVAYEWFQAQQRDTFPSTEALAPQEEVNGMFNQLEAALDAANFWQVANKKTRMWRNLRAIFLKAQLESHEVQSLRGVFRALGRSPRP